MEAGRRELGAYKGVLMGIAYIFDLDEVIILKKLLKGEEIDPFERSVLDKILKKLECF